MTFDDSLEYTKKLMKEIKKVKYLNFFVDNTKFLPIFAAKSAYNSIGRVTLEEGGVANNRSKIATECNENVF